MTKLTRRDVVAMGSLALGGCRRNQAKVIGVVPKGATQIFWQSVHAGAVKAGREAGLEIAWNAPPTESDRSRQIAIVDSMINRRVDGIAIAPVDRTALVGVVERAMRSGIPVVVFDSGIDTGNVVSYVATDNREGGRVAARRLGSLVTGKGKVGIISDQPGSASTTARVEGFQEVMRTQFPGVQMLDVQFGMADRAKARAIAENMLSAHPDLAGLFVDHESSAAGAALAFRARRISSVKFVAFDASEQLVSGVRDGVIDSLVMQNPFRMGYESVRALANKLQGLPVTRQLDTGSTLVRREDLDKPEIHDLLFPDLSRYLSR